MNINWLIRLALAIMFGLSFVIPGASPVLAAAPTNDDRANATVITALPFAEVVDTTEATVEADEPSFAQGCTGGNTVWYSFTPPYDMEIEVYADASNFTPAIDIYRLEAGSLTGWQGSCGGFAFRLQLSGGTTYYFQIGAQVFNCCVGGQVSLQLTEMNPNPPTATVTVDRFGTVDAAGSAVVTGSMVCSHNGWLNLWIVTLTQRVPGNWVAQAQASQAFECGPEEQTWILGFYSSSPVVFGPGRANVHLLWGTISQTGVWSDFTEQSSTVTLQSQRR